MALAVIAGIILSTFICSSCGKEEADNTGCGDEVTVNTSRVVITKADIWNGSTAFFRITLGIGAGDPMVHLIFTKETKTAICTNGEGGDLWSEASVWIYEAKPIPGLSVAGTLNFSTSKRVEYTFTRTGAGVNMFHYTGETGWLEINEGDYTGGFNQVLYVDFPAKDGTEANINYVVDSLKVEVCFKNFYSKPKD